MPPAPASVPTRIKTDKEIELEARMAEIQQSINDLSGNLTMYRGIVSGENTQIATLESELTTLRNNLTGVANTHQSAYDSEKNRVRDLRNDIRRCNQTTDTTDISLNNITKTKNAQQNLNELNQKRNVDLPDLNRQYGDISTLMSDLNGSIETDEASKEMYDAQITSLSIQIGQLNSSIGILTSTKSNNISRLNKLENTIDELENTIDELIEKDYSNKVSNNQNILELSEYIDTSLNYLFSFFKKKLSADVFHEKIDQRDKEHESLYNNNKAFDILFYCFYFSFLLIMICTESVKREHFLIYIMVGLIPFIYPFVFKFILYLIKYLTNSRHGPKNAFVDINNTFIAYNE